MKNGMTMLMFVLGCCLFATAQGNTSGDPQSNTSGSPQGSMSGSSQGATTDSMHKHHSMNHAGGGKTSSMTGCISEKDGKFMMMNASHPDGVQLMSSEDLKAHVGHKVRVKGTMEKDNMAGESSADKTEDKMEGKSDSNMGAKSEDKMEGKSGMGAKSHSGMGMMEMNVTSMKMVSEHCDMAKMGNK